MTGARRRGRAAGLAATLALVLSAAAAPAAAQSLGEALATAYATNPTLRAARAELRAVNEGVPQALSNWRPQVTVNSAIGKRRFETDSAFLTSRGTTTPFEARAAITQPLYRGGRTVAGTGRAENEVLAQRAVLQSVEQLVLLNAAIAYMDVWRDQAVLDLTVNNERVLTRQLEATRDRFEVGELTRTDVAQAETRVAVAVGERVQAQGNLSASQAVFEEIVGIAPGMLEAPEPLVEGLPESRQSATSRAVAANPDVLAARYAEAAAQRLVREVIGELLPTVALTASVARFEESTSRDSTNEEADIIAEISVPLYQQGAVSSRVREAKQISNQRRIEIDEARRRIEQTAVSAWEALESARAQIRSFRSGVRSAEIALEGVRQENLVGARTILDILDAEQELLDAQVNLVRSRRDDIVAAFQLLSAVGALSARELDLPVELYDPEVDYRKVRNRWFGLDAPGVE